MLRSNADMTDEVQCQCSLCLREELCHCICSFHKFRWITLWPTRTLMKLCMNTMMLLKPKGPSAVQTGRHDGSNSPWQRVAASDQVCLQWLTTCGVCLPTDIPTGTRWAFIIKGICLYTVARLLFPWTSDITSWWNFMKHTRGYRCAARGTRWQCGG